MIILTVAVPFQLLIKEVLRPPFIHIFADPESAYCGMYHALLLIEAADPAGSWIVSTVPAQYNMHLIDEEQGQMPVMLISSLAIKFKEIAYCKGVGP
jgi:hypothetical protein